MVYFLFQYSYIFLIGLFSSSITASISVVITVPVTAIITAIVTILIMYLCVKHKKKSWVQPKKAAIHTLFSLDIQKNTPTEINNLPAVLEGLYEPMYI